MEMNEKKLKKIVGKGGIGEIRKEVSLLEDKLQFGTDVASRYNMHKIKHDGNEYLALDAKRVNRYKNQTGRGDFRYLFNKQYVRVAKHDPKGKSYRLVA